VGKQALARIKEEFCRAHRILQKSESELSLELLERLCLTYDHPLNNLFEVAVSDNANVSYVESRMFKFSQNHEPVPGRISDNTFYVVARTNPQRDVLKFLEAMDAKGIRVIIRPVTHQKKRGRSEDIDSTEPRNVKRKEEVSSFVTQENHTTLLQTAKAVLYSCIEKMFN
jgi:hypothetical protein